jgi:hypothetical protein
MISVLCSFLCTVLFPIQGQAPYLDYRKYQAIVDKNGGMQMSAKVLRKDREYSIEIRVVNGSDKPQLIPPIRLSNLYFDFEVLDKGTWKPMEMDTVMTSRPMSKVYSPTEATSLDPANFAGAVVRFRPKPNAEIGRKVRVKVEFWGFVKDKPDHPKETLLSTPWITF